MLTNAEWMVIITEHGSLVKRLRRRPLTAETRVRFPYGLLTDIYLIKYSPTRKHRIYAMFFIVVDTGRTRCTEMHLACANATLSRYCTNYAF